MPKMRPKTFLIRSSAPVRSRARVRATVVMFFTFWFQFFAAIIAAGLLYGAIYILMQDKAEKHIHHVAAEKDTNLTTAELAAYDGRTSGRPILVSLCGKIYDVMSSAALYGKGGQYNSFAGKDITVACAKFNKTSDAYFNAQWTGLTKPERELLAKWEDLFAKKYPEVGKVTDVDNMAPCPQSNEGIAMQADAYSTTLGMDLFAKKHIS